MTDSSVVLDDFAPVVDEAVVVLLERTCLVVVDSTLDDGAPAAEDEDGADFIAAAA